jgi:hypothetical protein
MDVDHPDVGVLRRLRARLRARLRRDEEGFGLLELVVASTVMMTALTSMAYVATNSFGTIAMSRERQTANGLLDEAMEQLRALPYDTIWLGLRTSDLAGDPRIIGAGTTVSPYRLAANNERIVNVSSNLTVAPIVPNRTTQTVNGVVYTVRMYLSYWNDDPTTGTVTATGYVDWYSGVQATDNAFVRTSTLIFSPAAAASAAGSPAAIGPTGGSTGCISTACYGTGGPTLPFFASTASVKGGRTEISAGSALGLSIVTPSVASAFQLAQIANVQGWASTENVSLPTASPPTVWGPLSNSSKADDDPASPGSTRYDSKQGSSAAPATATTTFASGVTNASLSATVGAASNYDTVSTIAATSAANHCKNLAGVEQDDGQACARTYADAGAVTATVSLDVLGLGLGSMDVLQQGASTAAVHTNRDLVSSGAGVCVGTSGTGCVHTEATRTITSLKVGAVPAALKPLGFGSLIELTGYSDTVTAEAGINAAAPTATSGGALKIWNGLGYTTIPWASAIGTSLTPSISVSSGVVNVSITANLAVGSPSTTPTTPTSCVVGSSSLACRTRGEAMLSSPLRGSLSYDVKVLGVSVLAFSMAIDMGDLSVSASYVNP